MLWTVGIYMEKVRSARPVVEEFTARAPTPDAIKSVRDILRKLGENVRLVFKSDLNDGSDWLTWL
jgi:hypothetical protein